MWSGFSSEIETQTLRAGLATGQLVACGAASHLRLKPHLGYCPLTKDGSRMWSGFSSEIETGCLSSPAQLLRGVACGAASHLRLKPEIYELNTMMAWCRMWSGFSSEIETHITGVWVGTLTLSHVERLLI